MTNKHLAKAKDYIGKGEQFYRKAADEIIAAKDEGWGTEAIARELGKSAPWVRSLVAWATNPQDTATPFSEPRGEKREASTARKVLRESSPEQIKQVLAELPASQLDSIASGATDALVSRARAKRAERQTEPTAGELMGGDRWDPAESWADSQIIALNNKARGLAAHLAKWGPVLGSMTDEDAFDYLQEAERLIAEARVAWQTRIRDGVAA